MGRAARLALGAVALWAGGCGGEPAGVTPPTGTGPAPPAVDLTQLSEARPLLRLRLHHPDDADDWSQTVWREDLPGLRTVLVCDVPGGSTLVSRTLAGGWSVEESALFEAAAANHRALPVPTVQPMELGHDVVLQTLEGESPFVATNALFLDRFPAMGGEHGVLVAVPVRTGLLALVVDPTTILPGLHRLSQIAPELKRQGPGGLSGDLYWWNGTQFFRFAVTPGAEDVAVKPPDEFVDLMNQLAPKMVPPGGAPAGD